MLLCVYRINRIILTTNGLFQKTSHNTAVVIQCLNAFSNERNNLIEWMMTSIWLDRVSLTLDEYIQTATSLGLFKVLILLISFIFFIDTKSILTECYLEMVTAWRVSPWARSLVSKIQGNKEYLSSILVFQDHIGLTRVQPIKKLQFPPLKDASTKRNNFLVIPGMEESFKKWFVYTDQRNGAKRNIVCDKDILHQRWVTETIMFCLMTLKDYSPFKDQKRLYQIPKLEGAIFKKYNQSLISNYVDQHFSKFFSAGNNRFGKYSGAFKVISNNHLNRISDTSHDCGLFNYFGRYYNGLRNGVRNGVLTSFPITSQNATLPKLLTQYQGTTKGFLDTNLIELNSLPEHSPMLTFKCSSSCDFLTSCLCQFAGHSTLTLILPSTKTIIYFDPCFQTSKIYQKKIVDHLLSRVCRLLQKPGGTWTVLSLKDPPKTFTRGECEILVKAFVEQVLRRSKSFTINPKLLKEKGMQMPALTKILGQPLYLWQMVWNENFRSEMKAMSSKER